MDKLMLRIGGIVSIIFGFGTIFEPRFYDRLYGRYWDFTSVRLPLGAVFIAYGVFLVWSTLKKRGNK